jgi:hypothetical protein
MATAFIREDTTPRMKQGEKSAGISLFSNGSLAVAILEMACYIMLHAGGGYES